MSHASITLPKTVAAMADRLYKLKALKAEAQAKLDAIDDERKAIEAELINRLPKDDSTGVQGKVARVSLIIKDVPQVEDWVKVYAYVAKQKAWHLLQKRVSSKAVEELWEDGKKVPGIVAYPKVTVSLNKIS
jgi:hypothetical protein